MVFALDQLEIGLIGLEVLLDSMTGKLCPDYRPIEHFLPHSMFEEFLYDQDGLTLRNASLQLGCSLSNFFQHSYDLFNDDFRVDHLQPLFAKRFTVSTLTINPILMALSSTSPIGSAVTDSALTLFCSFRRSNHSSKS